MTPKRPPGGLTQPGRAAGRSLSSTAARGALVTLTGQGARIVLQFAGIMILARLLSPHDYGLFAIVVVVVGVGEIFRDFGLSAAAVRSPDMTHGQSVNLFWVNTGIGIALAALLFACAEPLAAAAGQPEVLMISRVLACIFVLNGLATQFRAILMRRLRFRWLASVDVIGAALALGSAIACALMGWQYWALVVQQIVQAAVTLIGAVWGAGWLPGLPVRSASIRSFLRFGGNLVLTQAVNYVTNNVDTAVVGFAHGATALGLYNRAYQLIMTPLAQIQSPVTAVALPVLSKLQDDQQRFAAYLIRGQLALGYAIALPLSVVCVAAEPITMLLLGPGWLAAAPLLQLFAIAGIARTLAFVGYWVYVVRGLSGSLLRYTLVSGAIKVICVAVGALWGVVGVAAGLALAPWLAWPLSLWWLSRVTTVPTRAFYGGALRIITVAAAGALATLAVTASLPNLPAPAALAVAITAVLATACCICLIPAFRRDARDIREVVVLMVKRRAPSRRDAAVEATTTEGS